MTRSVRGGRRAFCDTRRREHQKAQSSSLTCVQHLAQQVQQVLGNRAGQGQKIKYSCTHHILKCGFVIVYCIPGYNMLYDIHVYIYIYAYVYTHIYIYVYIYTDI